MLYRLLNPKNYALPVFLLLIIVACATKLNVPGTENIKHLKYYTSLSVPASKSYWTNAGVKLEAGDKLLILASGTVNTQKRRFGRSGSKTQYGPSRALKVKIGDSDPVMYQPKFYKTISIPGELRFIVQDRYYEDNSGSFQVDVFIIAKEKEIYLSDILTDFLAQNPEDEIFKAQLNQLYLANIDDIKRKSTTELQEIWENTISNNLRTNIVWELEKRGSISSLINCLSTFDKGYYEFAELWDSATISNFVDILGSLKRLGASEAIRPVAEFLDNKKYEVRWHALDTIGAIKAPESVDAIAMALYDQDYQIRLKVIQSLKRVGHRKAIKPLSILLADDKKDVRIQAELALKKLGVSEGQILDWKQKAKTIALDDLYKEALKAKLKSEADVKQTPVKQSSMVGIDTAKRPIYLNIDFGNYTALVIGNNNYQHLPQLKTAQNDAKKVAETLKDKYGFKVKLILDAKRSDILLALNDLRWNLTKRDNLLIYYAGHGWLDKEADEGYWLPVDAEKNNMLAWISNSSITTNIRALKAKHVLIVADSCYSGKLARGIHIVNRTAGYLSRLSGKRARCVISSGGLEPVIDSGGRGQHSVFASAFLDTLRENEGIMDGTQLFDKLRRPVMLNSDQIPEYSDIRKAGHEGGEFLFVREK